ncbi:MAG: hypothetical protein ACWA5U_04415 [bacterium]
MLLNKAIDLTKYTIEKRSTIYRNLIVFISLSLAISPIISLLSLSWSPLVAWLAIPFFYSIFLSVDHHLLSKWQFDILSHWKDDKLKLSFLGQSLLHLPIFPESTIKSMLGLLPQHQKIDTLRFEERTQIIKVLKVIHHCHNIRNIVLVLSTFILFIAPTSSFFLNKLPPLLLLILIILFYLLEKFYFNYQWKKKIANTTNSGKTIDILNTLDWYPLRPLNLNKN